VNRFITSFLTVSAGLASESPHVEKSAPVVVKFQHDFVAVNTGCVSSRKIPD
jgi:hypothetical protein